MNTELRRFFVGAIEESAFHHGTQFRVSQADVACCRKISVTDTRGQPVLAKKPSGAAS